MKRYFTLLLLTVCFGASAQTDFMFADTTAQWNVLETQWCMTAPCIYFTTYTYQISGDTIIGNYSYQKIKSLQGEKDFIRKDSTGKVFHRDSINEYMLYDFGAAAGDTFSIHINQWANPAHVEVQYVDTVTYGKPRKRMGLCINFWQGSLPCGNLPVLEAVDGIGVVNSHFLYPGMDYSVTDGPSYQLLCYSENDSVLYHSSVYPACVLDSAWSSVDELNPSEWSIQYSHNMVQVKNTEEVRGDVYFHLYDLTGRLILQKELTEQTTRIDVNGITRGVYLYSVQTNGRAIKKGKLIIE